MTELENNLEYMLSLGIPGVSVRVLHRGKPVFAAARGWRDAEKTVPMDGNERLNFYSLSKPVTCTAALMLAEEGALRLSDPVWRYLPAFRELTVRTPDGIKKAETEMTLFHLFTMTSGLGYGTDTPSVRLAKAETGGRCPTVKTMEYLAREPLDFEPGTRWQYSLSHDVLAAVVEVVSGERFSDFIRHRIFDPLGMRRSTFLLPEEELDSIAPQFGFLDGKRVQADKHIQYYKFGSEYEAGGAGLISCTEDYLRFAEALRTHALLKPETFRDMTTDRLCATDRGAFWIPEYGYGLGLRCPDARRLHTDVGWGGAAGAYLIVDPENELTVVFGQHVLASPDKNHCRDLIRDGALALIR